MQPSRGISAMSGPMGSFTKSVHRYSTELTIDPAAAGAATSYVLSLNGLYDPDVSGVGHQPMAFDEMNGIYNDYVVYGAKFEVYMLSTDSGGLTIVGTTVYPGSGTTTVKERYIENPNTMFKMLSNQTDGNSTAFFSKYVDIAQIYGRTRSQLITEDYFKGNGSANPTDLICLILWAAGYNGGNTAPVGCQVRITYFTHWFNPKLGIQS